MSASTGSWAIGPSVAGSRKATPEIATLRGIRFLPIGETGERDSMNLARMKWITGGDKLTARNLYGAPFEFLRSHLPMYHTNHLPRLGDSSEAIRRRILKIEFAVQIPLAERDGQLAKKLEAEAAGIALWQIEGFRAYRAMGGLCPPKSVQVASDEYVSSEDSVLRFLTEECEHGDALVVFSKPLYEAYKWWAVDVGEEPLSQTAFSRRLTTDGYRKEHKREGWQWLGIELTPEQEWAQIRRGPR